jgi:predicted branched-subunit amino acid permease
VSSPIQRPGSSRAARVAAGLAAAGGISIVASMLIGFLIADHSSSDSSPSSLLAIGLAGIGVMLVVLGCAVFTALALGWLWRRARRLPRRARGLRHGGK